MLVDFESVLGDCMESLNSDPKSRLPDKGRREGTNELLGAISLWNGDTSGWPWETSSAFALDSTYIDCK